ncbi:SGNH/GDSL hydrolase family protein [Patescibacteria group bacterium]
MVIGLPKKGPGNLEQQPEPLKRTPLLKKIERSAASRDRVTEKLLNRLITPKRTARRFVVDACKLAGIKPPTAKESLAPFVYGLQKRVCKFKEKDYGRGCDGKLGPLTYAALLQAIPKLKIYDKKFRGATARKEIKEFAKKEGLLAQNTTTSDLAGTKKEKDTKLSEAQKASPDDTTLSGDSLLTQVARNYAGRKYYKKYHNRYFRGGMSIRWMRRKLEKYPEKLRNSKVLVLGGGANDIYYRSPEWILREARRIIDFARSVNPNIRIIVLKLHGDGCKYWRRKPRRTKNKLLALNRGFDALVSEYSNTKSVDVRREIRVAKQHGKRMLSKDGLHYNRRGSIALGAKLRDEVETGTSRPLHEYA